MLSWGWRNRLVLFKNKYGKCKVEIEEISQGKLVLLLGLELLSLFSPWWDVDTNTPRHSFSAPTFLWFKHAHKQLILCLPVRNETKYSCYEGTTLVSPGMKFSTPSSILLLWTIQCFGRAHFLGWTLLPRGGDREGSAMMLGRVIIA